MSKKSKYIDVAHIKRTDCESRNFPLQELGIKKRPPGFQVVVRRSTLNAMKRHGRTSLNAEVGGMLLGKLCWEVEPFLLIEASIIGEHTNENTASVTFTAETWDHVWKEQEEKYPNTSIIGWYHTHPGFGIFLSHMDLFICEHTFNAPHQVAYVYDPQSEDEGWFYWKNSRPTKMKELLIIEDEPALPVTPTLPVNTAPQSRRSSLMRASAEKIVISSDNPLSKWANISIFVSTGLLLVCMVCLLFLVLHVRTQSAASSENVQLKKEIEVLKGDLQRVERNLRNNVDEIHRWCREHSAFSNDRQVEGIRRHINQYFHSHSHNIAQQAGGWIITPYSPPPLLPPTEEPPNLPRLRWEDARPRPEPNPNPRSIP
jgi:proteasome lid subunit RPN8/RPN11